MNRKRLLKAATKVVKRMGKEVGQSPLGRAARGKKTRGYF